MTNQPRIDFVNGVDRYGAKPPVGFPYRFAVLTWFENRGEMAEPWSLFRATIPRIGDLVGSDRVMAEYWVRQRTGILFRRFEETLVAEVAWSGLMHCSDDELQAQTFPSRFRFIAADAAVLVADTEPWNTLGGPLPYHDSVTVSFFSATPMHEDIERIFAEEAGNLGIQAGKTESDQRTW